MFFPFPPMETTFFLLVLTTLYTVSSGFYGVVLTDLVQGVLILISSVVIAFLAWHMVPDTASLAATARQVTGNANWTDAGISVHTTMPPGYEAYEPLLMIATFYLFRNILGGMGTGAESRYFGARSDRDCGLQSVLQGVTVMFRWPLMIGFAVMGIYLVKSLYPNGQEIQNAANLIHHAYPRIDGAHWHDLTSAIINQSGRQPPGLVANLKAVLGADWRGKLPLIGFRGTVNPEQILPAVLLNSIPPGLKGTLVVALLAAMMSCKNGTVNGASAFFVKDIYQNFLRPSAANRELIFASYGSTIGIVVVGFYFGTMANSINALWSWIIMSLTAGSLGPGLLRLYWWRCNAWGMLVGLVLGVVGSIVQRILVPDMPEWEQLLIMSALSFGGTIGGSLLTAPTPAPILRNFYRTTRPFGLWAPLRGEFRERTAPPSISKTATTSSPSPLPWSGWSPSICSPWNW
jgi:Na+/proline symporter